MAVYEFSKKGFEKLLIKEGYADFDREWFPKNIGKFFKKDVVPSPPNYYTNPKKLEAIEITPEVVQEFLERQSKGFKEIPDGEALIKFTYSVPSPSSEFGKMLIYDISKDYVDFKNKHTKIDIDFESFWILSCELQKYRQVYENWRKKYEYMDEDFKKQLDEYFRKMPQTRITS